MILFFKIGNITLCSYSLFTIMRNSLKTKLYKDFAYNGYLLNPNFTTNFNHILDNLVFFGNQKAPYIPDVFLTVPFFNMLYVFKGLLTYKNEFQSVFATFLYHDVFTEMSIEEKTKCRKNFNIEVFEELIQKRVKEIEQAEILARFDALLYTEEELEYLKKRAIENEEHIKKHTKK